MQCHAKACANMFKMGETWGEKGEWRVRRAQNEVITVVPQMEMTQKDHKPLKEDGTPATRPICAAQCTMNQRISNTVSNILGALAEADDDSFECTSTEDLISKVNELNNKIREGTVKSEDLMVGSLDVKALYPSIDVKQAGKICKDRIMESSLKIEGLDMRW